jgi:hypothetical protein
VQVQATEALSAAPEVNLWQEGSTGAIPVTMNFNSNSGYYVGQVLLDSTLDQKGYVEVRAVNSTNDEVIRHQPFQIQVVDAAEDGVHIISGDNNFELVLPVDALDSDAIVSVQSTSIGTAEQGGLVRVGSAYLISISTGQNQFSVPVVANMRYIDAAEVGVRPETLRLYRWNAAQDKWLIVPGGQVDSEHNLISSEVQSLGPFALFGIPESGSMIYLPLTTR